MRHLHSPLLVLAGAGTGKTGVITHKIAALTSTAEDDAGSVFAVTFTNKAAREMRDRVARLVPGERRKTVHVSTFHSLGMRMLREDGTRLGFTRAFSIFDAEDCDTLLAQLAGELNLACSKPEVARWRISGWKNDLIAPGEARAGAADEEALVAAQLYGRYQSALAAYNAVDFDDLVLRPVELLREHPETLVKWRARVRHLLVDEYQDTNNAQYALVRELVGERGCLTVVGDDDQSIYAWRGARPENLQRLAGDFPNLEIIKLEQNYRSTGRILRAANTLIGNNPHLWEKSLWSAMGPGEKPRVLSCRDADDEAERVVAELMTHRFRHRTRHRDYAILYRGNHQSRGFERALRLHDIPYQVSGGTAFFERSEIKDVLAYLRLLVNPLDDAAFLRVCNTPRREIGPTSVERLGAFARERRLSLLHASVDPALSGALPGRAARNLADFGHWVTLLADNAERGDPLANVEQLLADSGYRDWVSDTSATPKAAETRLANVQELLEWLARLARDGEQRERSLAEMVAHITLLDRLDNQQDADGADAVQLMTLHAAKGLEFPYVFITGMEESLLPHHASDSEQAIVEERRLAYVGITRAQRELTFTLTRQRQRFGEWVRSTPSRFLDELPAEDLLWEGRETLSAEEQQARGKEHLAGLRALLSNS